MKKTRLFSNHPIADIQSNVVFANNGNVVICFEVDLPEIYSLSEKDYDELHSVWHQAIKSLPTGCVVHKQDVYTKQYYSGEDLPKKSFLAKATADHFTGRACMEHVSYLFFTLTRNKAFNNPKYMNPFKRLTHEIPTKMNGQVKDFIASVNDSVSYINNSRKITLDPLAPNKILKITEDYFNGFNEGLDTDIILGKKDITIGDHYFDVLAINSELCFAEGVQSSKANTHLSSDKFVFHQGFIDGMGLTLKENHIVNQIIYLDNKQKWRRILEQRINELKKSSNFGSLNKVNLSKLQHTLNQINEDDSSLIIRGQSNIIFWDKELSYLEKTAAGIRSEFKELDIIPYYPGGQERINYYLNSHFCFSSNFSDEDLYVTDLKHALCLTINNSNYKSDTTGIFFNDRVHNIPIRKDVWDKNKTRIKARNFAIFAPTGEGKSFLANSILRQFFEDGVRIIIIDLGGSYTKFAKLYPGQFALLKYKKGENLGINPFYVENTKNIDLERLEDLTVFILELMNSGITASKIQSVSIKKILNYYYQKVPAKHSLSGFYRFIEEHQESLMGHLNIRSEYFDIQEFLHIMSEYVGDGIYSFLFKIDENRSFQIKDKRLIVFDLDEVKENKEVLSVMLKLLKTAIQQTIWRNPSERGIILFDEFAKQLKFKNVLESVEFYYQAIRKQNGAIGIILQSINQLPRTSTSASILDNTQVIYSLYNEKGYEDLKTRLKLSNHDHLQLKSIRNNLNGPRKYTEIFIKIGKESNIFRLEVPKEVYAAYLTDGEENEQIMTLYRELGDMEKAIQVFVQKLNPTINENT